MSDKKGKSDKSDLLCVDSQVTAVCDFVTAYEKEKFRIMNDDGKLLSVACFMVDYCTALRSSTATN